MSTKITLNHHLQALSEGIEAIISDYNEQSVLFTPEGPIYGIEGIQSFFENFLNNSPQDLLEAITLVRQDIDGEIAYIIWKAEPYIPFATDTFVIRNEKISVQTFAAYMTSSERT